MSRLAGKVALVTGGSRGIGAAIARRLARDGARVVLTYRRANEPARAIVGEIGGGAVALRADLGFLPDVANLFSEVDARLGRLDILVNNAAVAEYKTLNDVNLDHYEDLFNVNVRGLVFATQEAARRMPSGGRIINISSGAATATPPGSSLYNATKAAVNALTQSWAAELGPRGITVNVVAPGITDTEMLHTNMADKAKQALISQTPMGRLGTPDDIADVVAFLASEDARWVTGQIIGASGGLR